MTVCELFSFYYWTLDTNYSVLAPTHRERMNLKAPIYFSTGLTEKANHYYKLFITWTNQKIRKTFVQRNMFEFKHIKAFDRSYADNPGPMVSFRLVFFHFISARMFKKVGSKVMCVCVCRLCLPHQGCCTPVSPCRSSRNGLETRRTWWVWSESEWDHIFFLNNTS